MRIFVIAGKSGSGKNTTAKLIKKYYDTNGEYHEDYYKFTRSKLLKLDNYSTLVQYGDVTIDVNEKEVIYIEELDEPPKTISIGSGVTAELGMQVKFFTYSVEEYCPTEKKEYMAALMNYSKAVLGLEEISKEQIEKQLNGYFDEKGHPVPAVDDEYFIWKDDNFYVLTKGELIGEGGYLFRDVVIYHPAAADLLASQATIDNYYETLQLKEELFIQAIEILLDAQEKGAL